MTDEDGVAVSLVIIVALVGGALAVLRSTRAVPHPPSSSSSFRTADRPPAPPSSGAARLAMSALVVAAGPAAYLLIGDLSEPAGEDRIWAPLPSSLAEVLGVIGIVTLFVSAVVLVVERRRHEVSARLLAATAMLGVVAVLAALTYRLGSAKVTGANIGFGGIVLFGTPVALTLAVGAVVLLASDRHP